MRVTRMGVIANGMTGRCPNCGQRTLFQEGRLFKVNKACPNCGLRIENGDGAFLGPFVINYGVTVFCLIIPVIALYASGKLGADAALAITIIVGLVVPLLLYRLSWGWWLMLYYLLLPDNLPGNLDGRPEDDD